MNFLDQFNERVAKKTTLIDAENTLPGRDIPIETANFHFVLEHPIKGPFPSNMEKIVFGLGCFWGAERKFWKEQGVYVTAVGYSAGYTPNPTYEEVCTGKTAHNEVVLVVFDPEKVSLQRLLKVFWESHNPTQGMRQGNDVGTQYRSGVYYFSGAQKSIAEATKASYQKQLSIKGVGEISTEIIPAGEFYYAESYHQQYLAKNPDGYCGLGGTGVALDCP